VKRSPRWRPSMYERDCLIGVHMEAQVAWMRSLLVVLSDSTCRGIFFAGTTRTAAPISLVSHCDC
jgi:hypothetical protein